MKKYLIFSTAFLSLTFALELFAQSTLPGISVKNTGGSTEFSLNIQALLFMTTLTFLPALLLTTSSFTRIIIVLAILRQAIGTTQTPSNQILLGLSLFLTLFIMSPVYQQSYDKGIKPYMDEEISQKDALESAVKPVREFMLSQTRENDLLMFSDIAEKDNFKSPEEVPLHILLPSFVTSELKTAFQIGFLLFIPFLIIDLVVASVLMSMGMMMLSPLIISLPFKIMLFVLVDGWALILGSLASSFS